MNRFASLIAVEFFRNDAIVPNSLRVERNLTSRMKTHDNMLNAILLRFNKLPTSLLNQ